jgi:exodeoxyribonuclease VII small subunit
MSDFMTEATPPSAATAVGYAAAMSEIESILGELESSSVDVDHLAERVRRASALIALCRDRIQHARLQIDQVVSQLDSRN